MGVFDRLFEAIACDPDIEWLMIAFTTRLWMRAASRSFPPHRYRKYQHCYENLAI
jgi:hypothetical protein